MLKRRPARRCDNITISPALLGELAASTEPLPRKLWPEMGGGEGAPVDLSASQVPPPPRAEHAALTRPAAALDRLFSSAIRGMRAQLRFSQHAGPCLPWCSAWRLQDAASAARRGARARAGAAARQAARFEEMHGGDQMAVEKLAEGVKNFSSDQEALEKLIAELKPEAAAT